MALGNLVSTTDEWEDTDSETESHADTLGRKGSVLSSGTEVGKMGGRNHQREYAEDQPHCSAFWEWMRAPEHVSWGHGHRASSEESCGGHAPCDPGLRRTWQFQGS